MDQQTNKKKRAKKIKSEKDIMRRKRGAKLRFISFCFIGLFGFLTFKIFQIKAEYGDEFERNAIVQQVQSNGVDTYVNPNRGTIVDRNQNIQALAVSNTVYNVIMDVRLLASASIEVQQDTVEKVSRILEIPESELWEALATNPETGKPNIDRNYYKIYNKLDTRTKTILEEENPRYIWFEEDTERVYPNGSLAASLIGFVRGDNSSWGLEAKYNAELTGEQGRIVRMYDQDNNVVTEKVSPIQGHTVVTTLDLMLQQEAEKIVEKYGEDAKAEHATILVMDPRTGELLVMAEYPSFDLNDPFNIEKITSSTIRERMLNLSDEERMEEWYKVWRNFSISNGFEQGSIYKPLVVAAALEEGVITMNDTFFCGGGKTVLDRRINCWNRNGHGNITTEEVLAYSCNVGMMEIINKIGRDKYYEYQKDYGMGEYTDIDLIGEANGIVYTATGLNPVELATTSMGQGFTVTAVQAITGFASVINGGYLMEPYVVSQIIDENDNVLYEKEPQVVRKVISKEVSEQIRNALKKTITPEGTGKGMIIDGYSIAGKTGTAQTGADRDGLTLTFAGFFPADEPEYLILTVVAEPGNYVEGSSQTIPMAREMIESIISQKRITPTEDTSGEIINNPNNDIEILENYVGRNIADVSSELNRMGMNYEISSPGSIIADQRPAAGSQVKKGSKIYFTLEDNGIDSLTFIPNVTGMTKSQAEETLENANLVPIFEYQGDPPADTGAETQEGEEGEPVEESRVVNQLPGYEINVQYGTQIKLILD